MAARSVVALSVVIGALGSTRGYDQRLTFTRAGRRVAPELGGTP